ncbi:hypothetical protein WA1_09350 [Scytonema hofmannii PCC 7110]|uniref:Uncharacterized protein n=1 Tax=Scytonema hofmannii PCC 7110 TaxID=128403 RepID=A0A139WSD1_9CYAN|nr:hypothetical protein [Scytonema hofmannii]KYC35341.1 hypothetical protein WA1_09350 [Scytonema hofmannii PCC 7110]
MSRWIETHAIKLNGSDVRSILRFIAESLFEILLASQELAQFFLVTRDRLGSLVRQLVGVT